MSHCATDCSLKLKWRDNPRFVMLFLRWRMMVAEDVVLVFGRPAQVLDDVTRTSTDSATVTVTPMTRMTTAIGT